ncbi:MAG: histidine phosphatase family protein [Nitrospirota bacterium]
MSGVLPKVYLVRHGETAWTISGQHTGHTDIPLTERGERDAQELSARLRGLTFAKVLTSPLQRARRTGELAGFGERAEPHSDLMEWDYGTYEGRRTSDIRVERPDWRLFEDGCLGGETVEAVGVRADRVIGRIRALAGDILVFAHRDILRILAIRWLSLRAVEARHLYLATASLSILGYDHDLDEPVIRLWNDGRHPIHSLPPETMMPEPI